MDHSERLVEQYLNSLGLGQIVYEPDGNIPPDFAIGGAIAVEVRRLNQNYELSDGSRQGLEQLAIPLVQSFKRFLPTLGESVDGECWYVFPDFCRPLKNWKEVRPSVESLLRAFMHAPLRTSTRLQVTPNLKLDLMRSGKDHGPFFLLGGYNDKDSGGWVMSELERNLRLCVAEKEAKIAPYRSRYDSWWLILADHIDYAMGPEDRGVFRAEVMSRIAHGFEKIILIDPRDYRHTFEV